MTKESEDYMKFPPPTSFLPIDFDNFQQYWKQNTEDEIHRDKGPTAHDHVHVKFEASGKSETDFNVDFFTGRNNENKMGQQKWIFKEDADHQWTVQIDDKDAIEVVAFENGFEFKDGSFRLRGDTLRMDDFVGLPNKKSVPYRLVKCRYFSGWLQYPMPDNPDSIYFQSDLILHDQGGMVELDIPGVNYTAELTQLVFAHKIRIMKLAIYEEQLQDVGINSKSISYTWTNPEAKRLGINLRKIISGWTLIEEGFLNSNNLNDDE